MTCCRVSRGPRNLRLMVRVPPPHFGLRSLGNTNLPATDPSQPLHGGHEHLRLPTKHDEHPTWKATFPRFKFSRESVLYKIIIFFI
jgi:hypothetical protein